MNGDMILSNPTARPRCEGCGDGCLNRSVQEEVFLYGSGADAVELRASVPVWSCDACGEAFTDAEAEDLRHEAVCRHLKRLTPAEVLALRGRRGLTQEGFADLTRFGVASVKRWESGNQIQSESADRYLRLLGDEAAFARMQAIVAGLGADAEATKTFRTPLSQEARARSEAFSLRPARILAGT